MTCFWTEADGWCWFFGTIAHATDELVGWKVTKRGDRWAAVRSTCRRQRPRIYEHSAGRPAYRRGVELDFIRAGKPVDNAFIESFNGKLRDE